MIKRIFAPALVLALTVGVFAQDICAASLQSAKGAVVIEAGSGRVIMEHNSDEKLPNASTTKIMTALITLEQPELDKEFTVDENAIMVEGSSMGLQKGDKVTLRDLAWGMLLSSGNDAANAAAVRIDGSLEAFCGRMNRRAKELGMENTNFSSPSGLELGEHYTTAADMARLAAAAMKNENFSLMARSKSAKLCYGNPPYHRWITNHNRLLWQCEDCVGIKTGFTKAAGRCLVSAAERDGLMLIAVTLGCPDDFTLHHDIYEECFSSLSFFDMSGMLENLSVPVTGAELTRVPVRALWSPGAYLSGEEPAHVQLSISIERFLYAPVAQGQPVGEATVKLFGETISAVPLVSSQEVPSRFIESRSILQQVKDFFERPQNYRFPLNEPWYSISGEKKRPAT